MSFFQQFPKAVYDFQSNGIDTRIVDLFRFVKVQDLYSDDLSIYTYQQINNGERPDILSNTLYGTPEYYWTFFVVNDQLKSGLSAWPMSSGEFDAYMDEEYSGTVIQTYPTVVNLPTGTEYRNSLAGTVEGASGTFFVGDMVTGMDSGATGYVVSVDVQLSQILLRNINGTFNSEELIRSGDESASVQIGEIYVHRDAPHHYEDSEGNILYSNRSIDETIDPVTGVGTNILNPALTIISNYEYEMQLNDERANLRIVRPEAIYNFAKTFRELINA